MCDDSQRGDGVGGLSKTGVARRNGATSSRGRGWRLRLVAESIIFENIAKQTWRQHGTDCSTCWCQCQFQLQFEHEYGQQKFVVAKKEGRARTKACVRDRRWDQACRGWRCWCGTSSVFAFPRSLDGNWWDGPTKDGKMWCACRCVMRMARLVKVCLSIQCSVATTVSVRDMHPYLTGGVEEDKVP